MSWEDIYLYGQRAKDDIESKYIGKKRIPAIPSACSWGMLIIFFPYLGLKKKKKDNILSI